MSTEHTYVTEAAAKAARRAHINAGASVSLIGYDSMRNVYAYDVLDQTIEFVSKLSKEESK